MTIVKLMKGRGERLLSQESLVDLNSLVKDGWKIDEISNGYVESLIVKRKRADSKNLYVTINEYHSFDFKLHIDIMCQQLRIDSGVSLYTEKNGAIYIELENISDYEYSRKDNRLWIK